VSRVEALALQLDDLHQGRTNDFNKVNSGISAKHRQAELERLRVELEVVVSLLYF
jgi:hypothetical protein